MDKGQSYNTKPYVLPTETSDMLSDAQIPIIYHDEMKETEGKLRVLSLFSGCGGMDLGFEGSFIAHRKSFPPQSLYIDHSVNKQEYGKYIHQGFDGIMVTRTYYFQLIASSTF